MVEEAVDALDGEKSDERWLPLQSDPIAGP
jgi:hypothetical protein